MIDPTHLLKCIRNNFLRKNCWQMKDRHYIAWGLLDKLMKHEKGLTIKKAHPLTNEVLHPNNFQRMRVSLAVKMFSWLVRNALIYYATKEPLKFPAADVQTTTEFKDHVHRFFQIFNINCVKKGPITSMTCPKVTELFLIRDYFESTIIPSGMLTLETGGALILTINAAFLLVENLLNSGVRYVLTSRFQQDPLEEYFGAQ